MAHTYTDLSDDSISHKKPITLQQGRALRDNPIAIAEGADGAPWSYGAWHPFDSVAVGDAKTGLLYDQATDGAVAMVATPAFDAGWDYRIVFRSLVSAQNTALTLAVFSGSWRSPVGIDPSVAFISNRSGFVDLMEPQISRVIHSMSGVISNDNGTGGSAVQASPGAATRIAGGGAVTQARLSPGAGNFTAGKVWLYKRRSNGGVPA